MKKIFKKLIILLIILFNFHITNADECGLRFYEWAISCTTSEDKKQKAMLVRLGEDNKTYKYYYVINWDIFTEKYHSVNSIIFWEKQDTYAFLATEQIEENNSIKYNQLAVINWHETERYIYIQNLYLAPNWYDYYMKVQVNASSNNSSNYKYRYVINNKSWPYFKNVSNFKYSSDFASYVYEWLNDNNSYVYVVNWTLTKEYTKLKGFYFAKDSKYYIYIVENFSWNSIVIANWIESEGYKEIKDFKFNEESKEYSYIWLDNKWILNYIENWDIIKKVDPNAPEAPVEEKEDTKTDNKWWDIENQTKYKTSLEPLATTRKNLTISKNNLEQQKWWIGLRQSLDVVATNMSSEKLIDISDRFKKIDLNNKALTKHKNILEYLKFSIMNQIHLRDNIEVEILN